MPVVRTLDGYRQQPVLRVQQAFHPVHLPMTYAMMHRTTDPACAKHLEPRTRLSRLWYEHRRGLPCLLCHPDKHAEVVRQENE